MASIFFYNIPAYGHTLSTLAVVRRLVQRGHQVTYYNTENFRAVIEKTGATFRPYQVPVTITNPALILENPFRFVRQLTEATELLLPELVPPLLDEKPDLVIHDTVTPWGWYLAKIARIKAAAFSSVFAFPERIPRERFESTQYSLAKIVRDGTVGLSDLVYFWNASERLRRQNGITRRRPFHTIRNEEPLTLVATSGTFQPFREDLGSHFKFIGPQPRDGEEDLPLPLTLPERTPVVYISLGTVYNSNLEFFQTVLEAFAGEDIYCVLSAGPQFDLTRLGPPPANFHITNFIPQAAMLRCTDIFISHCGMGSTHDALIAGVPLVCVPQGSDQELIAQQVVRRGVGIWLRPNERTASDLRGAVQKILADPAYQQAARNVGDSLMEAGGPERGVELVEEYLSQKDQ